MDTAALLAPVRPEFADLPHGWFHHGPKVVELLERYQPKVVVELGSWLGQSAIAMARVVRQWGGAVTCIDTWAGELDEHGGSPSEKRPLMILSCACNIVNAGVAANVRLIPATTELASNAWTQPIDFLYVDADHSHRGVLADLSAWVPHVRRGGVIAGDDYEHPRYPGVKTAWDLFERERNLKLIRYQSDPPVIGGIRLIYGEV